MLKNPLFKVLYFETSQSTNTIQRIYKNYFPIKYFLSFPRKAIQFLKIKTQDWERGIFPTCGLLAKLIEM